MKNSFARAMEDLNFREFIARYKETANFFVAYSETDKDQQRALLLCLADAWLEAKGK